MMTASLTTSPTGKRGFTLTELLTVLAVLVIVMGIGVGGLLNTRRSTSATVIEHAVGDMIRQARHTSSSTGAPVQLLIRKNEVGGGGTITGVTQTPVFTETFDGDITDIILDPSIPPLEPRTIGASGFGWNIAFDPSILGSFDGNLLELPIETRRRLIYREGDGFYIGCWVRLPDPRTVNATATQAIIAAGTRFWPLVVIGPDSNVDNAIGFLAVERHELLIQKSPDPSAVPNDVTALHWLPAAWVTPGTDLLGSSGFCEPLVDSPALVEAELLHPSTGGTRDILTPILANRWHEIGFLTACCPPGGDPDGGKIAGQCVEDDVRARALW